jgi:hypothetical protein
VVSDNEVKTEFLRALDAVTPPAPWLRATVHTELRKESRSGARNAPQRSRARRFMRARRVGAFTAVLAVVLLLVTLLAGGYIWQDWQRFQKAQPVPAGRSIEAELRTRPLALPVVAPDADCPSTPMSVINYPNGPTSAYGEGPVYALGGLVTLSEWGTYFSVTYIAAHTYRGLALVRIRDLKTGGRAVFLGPYASGQVVGGDKVGGQFVQQHAELLLDASHPQTRLFGNNKWGFWNVQQGMPADWSHCFGIQIDGDGFTEIITGTG